MLSTSAICMGIQKNEKLAGPVMNRRSICPFFLFCFCYCLNCFFFVDRPFAYTPSMHLGRGPLGAMYGYMGSDG